MYSSPATSPGSIVVIENGTSPGSSGIGVPLTV